MHITAKKWNSLSIIDKLDLVKHEMGLTSEIELSRTLGINPRTLRYWRSGEKNPSLKLLKKMKALCVTTVYDDIKEEAYMALSSMSADASFRLLRNAIVSGDPMMLHMATHCIAIKFAALITEADDDKDLLINISSNYGPSAKTILKIGRAGDIHAERVVKVTVRQPQDTDSGFMLRVQTIDIPSKTDSQVAYVVSDKALVAAAKATFIFLKKAF